MRLGRAIGGSRKNPLSGLVGAGITDSNFVSAKERVLIDVKLDTI
jgi:hypothetical protein